MFACTYFSNFGVQTGPRIEVLELNGIQIHVEKFVVKDVDVGFKTGDINRTSLRCFHACTK